MKRIINVLKNSSNIALILILILVLVVAIRLQLNTPNHNNQITTPQPSQRVCASTPQLPIKNTGSNTPTPKPDEYGTIPKLAPSVTPLPISKITDLATDLSEKDKVFVYVMRCDGRYELFLLNPTVRITEAIPLEPGDVILDWIPPASLAGHEPPTLAVNPLINVTPTDTSYPFSLGTPVPYP